MALFKENICMYINWVEVGSRKANQLRATAVAAILGWEIIKKK